MTTTLSLPSTRFGEISFSQEDIVTMEDGLIGFPSCKRYLILAHKEGSPFRWLQAVEEPSLAFLLVDPGHFLPEYAPQISGEAASSLELDEDTPRLVYTIATIPKGQPEELTINLAGPIIINGLTRTARQLVIEDPNCPIKHRVFGKTSEQIAA